MSINDELREIASNIDREALSDVANEIMSGATQEEVGIISATIAATRIYAILNTELSHKELLDALATTLPYSELAANSFPDSAYASARSKLEKLSNLAEFVFNS